MRSDSVIALNFVTCYGMTGGRLERAGCASIRFIESNGGLLTMYRQFLSEIFNNGISEDRVPDHKHNKESSVC